MTRLELQKIFNLNFYEIKDIITQAGEIEKSIAKKMKTISLPNTNFTIKECRVIADCAKANELMRIYIEENCTERIDPDGFKLKGSNDFLQKWKNKHNIRCCNTCSGLTGRKREQDNMSRPYCTVYHRYLENFNAKVYEDYCSSYLYNHYEKPRVWFKQNAPINLNQFGETDTVNGIKLSEFKDRKNNEPINIIGDIGF